MSGVLARLGSDPAALQLASLLGKGTLLLAAAGMAGVALRNASAAARHLVWTLSLGGLLALPLLSAALPGWRLNVLPGPAQRTWTALPASPDKPIETATASPAAAVVDQTAAPRERTWKTPVVPASAAVGGGWWTRLPGGIGLGLALYLLGAALVLGWIGAGQLVLRRVARRASAPSDPAWNGLLRDLAWMMDVEAPVRLLVSPQATMPMTWGTRRPVVMLPADADAWPEERRRVVLLHELAHVARRDCLTQMLASVVCAVYWFHPGAWYAARRLRVERERASDDRVLAAGTPGHTYAAHLLEVARAFRSVGISAPMAVSMARPSQLEGRLLAVLDGVRERRTVSRRAALSSALAALALVLPLAAMQPAPRPAADGWTARKADKPSTAPAALAAPGALASTAKPQGTDGRTQEDPDIDRTVPARSGGTLLLELETGAGVTVSAWDRDEVRVTGDLRGADANNTRVTVEPVASGVRVHTGYVTRRGTYSNSHVLRIWTPRRYGVRVASSGGGVSIAGLQGDFSGHTGGGELSLRGVRGTAHLTTGGGEIYVADSWLDGEVRTGGGNVILRRVTGSLRGSAPGATAWAGPPSRRGAEAVTVDGSGSGNGNGNGNGVKVNVDEDGSTWVHTGSGTWRVSSGEGGTRVEREGRRTGSGSGGDNGFAFVTGEDPAAQRAAIRAMAAGSPPAAAAAGLSRLAFDSSLAPEVQREAVRSLGRLPGEVGTEQLSRIATTHESEEVRREAVAALAGRGSARARAALDEVAASDVDDGVRAAAGASGGSRGEGARTPKRAARRPGTASAAELSRAYDDAVSAEERESILRALSRSPERASTDKLMAVARSDRSPEMRAAALRYVSRKDDPRVTEFLYEMATRNP
jgi:beta-lactamase regulating signal transducer with metallopeptidase domain